jgi:hypothetical protein
MCAEGRYWQYHRRLVSDHLLATCWPPDWSTTRHDAILDLNALVGVQVQDRPLGSDLGLGRRGNRKQQNNR